MLTLVATLVAVLLPATVVYAGTTLGAAARAPEGKRSEASALDWTWSDGGSESGRAFLSSQFSTQSLPQLKVRVPAEQNGLLYLEFKQDGAWAAEWVTKPDARGLATLPIDPYCANGSWCDGTYEYRLKMPGLTSYFEISYWDE